MAVELTQERLKALLDYDEDTGHFTWRVRRGRARVGMTAGTTFPAGYVSIQVDGALYLAHRLAWLWVHGSWPADQLDHISGGRDDNRISNLRACSNTENQQNRGGYANKKSGLPVGVSPYRGRYQAAIRHAGKRLYLGRFPTPEEAHAAYLAAKADLHAFQPAPRSMTTLPLIKD